MNVKRSIEGTAFHKGFYYRVLHRLKGAMITVAAISLFASNTLLAQQSDNISPSAKNYLAKIADARYSPEFKALSKEEQNERIAAWLGATSKEILSDIESKIKEGRLTEAEYDAKFLKGLAASTGDTELVNSANKQEQEIETARKEHSRNDITNKIKHNDIGKSSIQETDQGKCITYTASSKDYNLAREKAIFSLRSIIAKNNYKIKGDIRVSMDISTNPVRATAAAIIQ